MNKAPVEQKLYVGLAATPLGRAATDGQVGKLAALAQGRRAAGSTLHHMAQVSSPPWHRIINAEGKIALPPDGDSFARQKALLVYGNQFNLTLHQWHPLNAPNKLP